MIDSPSSGLLETWLKNSKPTRSLCKQEKTQYMSSRSSESLLRQDILFIVRKRSVKLMSISNPRSFTLLEFATRKRCNASKLEKKKNHSKVTKETFLISMGTPKGKNLRYYFMLSY